MFLISLKNISKIFNPGKENEFAALKNVSLKIKKGEFVAVMGPSGSGKTTLLNIIGCLDRPTSGTYQLGGLEITKLKKDRILAKIRNQKIGFVFQTFNLLPRYNVIANVNLPLIYSQNKKNAKKRVLQILDKVGLKEKTHHKPNQLSGGEQQRVAIARALINNPQIILADEPTGNLDQKSGQMILDILKKLNHEGVTIILISHDLRVAREAQRIIKIEDGKII